MLCWRTLPLGRHDALVLLDLGTTPGHRRGQRKSKQKPLPAHGSSLGAFPRSPLHPRGWMGQRRQSFSEKGAGWFLCNWSLSKTSSHKCFHLWSSITRLQFLQYVAPLPYTLIWFLLVIRLRQLRVLNHILSSMIGGSALHIFFRSLENQSLVWRNKLGWVRLVGVELQVPSLCHRDGPLLSQFFAFKYKNYLLPNVPSCLLVSLASILWLGLVLKLSHDSCLSRRSFLFYLVLGQQQQRAIQTWMYACSLLD